MQPQLWFQSESFRCNRNSASAIIPLSNSYVRISSFHYCQLIKCVFDQYKKSRASLSDNLSKRSESELESRFVENSGSKLSGSEDIVNNISIEPSISPLFLRYLWVIKTDCRDKASYRLFWDLELRLSFRFW